MLGYLLNNGDDDGDDDDRNREEALLKMKLPSPTELESWKEKLPPGMEILAMICESDSGLGEAELLSDALSLDKRNGYNGKYSAVQCRKEQSIIVKHNRVAGNTILDNSHTQSV